MARQSNASLGIPTAIRWNARLYPRHKEMLENLAKLDETDQSTFMRSLIEEKAKLYGILIPAKFPEGKR